MKSEIEFENLVKDFCGEAEGSEEVMAFILSVAFLVRGARPFGKSFEAVWLSVAICSHSSKFEEKLDTFGFAVSTFFLSLVGEALQHG